MSVKVPETTSLAESIGPKTLVPIPARDEEPRIEVLKENDVVRMIRVSCSCGHEVDINCEYDQ